MSVQRHHKVAKTLGRQTGQTSPMWSMRLPLLVLISLFVSFHAFSAGDPAALKWIEKCDDAMESSESYQCLLVDEIRRESALFFQRRLADQVVERTMVVLSNPLKVQIQNRNGEWLVDETEAIKLDFGSKKLTILGEIRHLLEQSPNDIVVAFGKDALIDGALCHTVVATLSDHLTSTLADRFREEHRDHPLFKSKPHLDTLQFIAKRRLYWIGEKDCLLYKCKTYDGHEDLLSDQTASNQSSRVGIPSAVFEVPEDLPVFVAHTREELEKHNKAKVTRERRESWGRLLKQFPWGVTNKVFAAEPAKDQGGTLKPSTKAEQNGSK